MAARMKVKFIKSDSEMNWDGDFLHRRVNPRETRRMMQRMGMNMTPVEDVQQVIIKTSSKDIVVDDPEVAILEVQGQKIFQVVGGKVSEKVSERKAPTVPEEDARLVADQTGKSLEEARRALEESGGDLAKAILILQSNT